MIYRGLFILAPIDLMVILELTAGRCRNIWKGSFWLNKTTNTYDITFEDSDIRIRNSIDNGDLCVFKLWIENSKILQFKNQHQIRIQA